MKLAGNFLCLMALCSALHVEAAPELVSDYRDESEHAVKLCKLTLMLSNTSADSVRLGGPPARGDTDYQGCISKNKTAMKAKFDAAVKTIKAPAAKAALRGYHVAFVTALTGVNPGTQELQISYEQRQQALQDKLTEAWAKFEVEQ